MASSIPTCCQSCGFDVGHLWEEYWRHVRCGVSEREAMDRIGVQPWRYCCRATLLTFVPEDSFTRATHKAPVEGSKFRFRTTDMVAEETVKGQERELVCR